MSAGIACAALHKSELYAKLVFNVFVYVRHSFNSNSSQTIYSAYRKKIFVLG